MVKNYILGFLFLFRLNVTSDAQTFDSGSSNLLIPNSGTGASSTIAVNGLPTKMNAYFGMEKVCISVDHQLPSSLHAYLVSPSGTSMALTVSNGKSGANYTNTCFTMHANKLINDATEAFAPFSGSYIPQTDLGAFNNEQNPNGNWKFYVYDDKFDLDSGIIKNWSISFSSNPAPPFLSSDIPVFIITTNGVYIEDEPKKMVDLGIIYNGLGNRNKISDPKNHYNGKIGLEIRGSSSQQFPKKPYGFETWDSQGDEIDTRLFNFSSDDDYVLHAAYNDKTLMRNFLAYKLYEKMGNYSVKTQFVELIYNKSYNGIYLLTEKIERGKDKINIAKLSPTDVSGNALTGGYILSIDKKKKFPYNGFESKHASNTNNDKVLFQYAYPKSENIVTAQKEYIEQYVDSFENALNSVDFMDSESGYKKYINPKTFIDNFIINEVTKNIDAYRLSTYLYKQNNNEGGKLNNGPVWDYDLAIYNASFGGGMNTTGWQYEYGWNWAPTADTIYPTPFWWRKFAQDSNFVNELYCRYHQLRKGVLNKDSIYNLIDKTSMYIREARIRNFKRWPVIGKNVWPNPQPVPLSYEEEIAQLKWFLIKRLEWIDENLPGNCINTSIALESSFTDFMEFFPNPFNNKLHVRYQINEGAFVSILLFDYTGKQIKELKNVSTQAGTFFETFSLPDLAAGVYFVRVSIGNKIQTQKLIKY